MRRRDGLELVVLLATAMLVGVSCSGGGGSKGSPGTAGSTSGAGGAGGSGGASAGGAGIAGNSSGGIGGKAGATFDAGASGTDGGAAGFTPPPCNPVPVQPGNLPGCPIATAPYPPSAGASCTVENVRCTYIEPGLGCYTGGPYSLTCCGGVLLNVFSCPSDGGASDAASDGPLTSCPANQPPYGTKCADKLSCEYGHASCCGIPSSNMTCVCSFGYFDCTQTVECNFTCKDAGGN